MSFGLPFSPCPGGAQNVSVSNANSSSTSLTGSGNSLRLHNRGATECFYRVGDTTAPTASITADPSLPPGAIEIVGCGSTPFVSAITVSSTTTLNVCRGDGT